MVLALLCCLARIAPTQPFLFYFCQFMNMLMNVSFQILKALQISSRLLWPCFPCRFYKFGEGYSQSSVQLLKQRPKHLDVQTSQTPNFYLTVQRQVSYDHNGEKFCSLKSFRAPKFLLSHCCPIMMPYLRAKLARQYIHLLVCEQGDKRRKGTQLMLIKRGESCVHQFFWTLIHYAQKHIIPSCK